MTDSNYTPERRPIASREHALPIRLANELARRGVTANAISVAGMVAGLAGGAVLSLTLRVDHGWAFFLLAAGLMQLRLLANMLDGMVAMQTGQASPVGELYNEIPDRVSDSDFLIGAGYAAGGVPELGLLAALAAVFTAYVRAQGKAAGSHQEFCGPLAKPQRMAMLTLAAVYAGLAPAAWQPLLSWNGAEFGLMAIVLVVITAGSLLTALRRIRRIAAALRGKQP